MGRPHSFLSGNACVNLLFDCHTFDVGPQGTTTFLAGLLNALPDAAQNAGRPLTIEAAAHDEASVRRFVDVPVRYCPMSGGFITRNLSELPAMTRTPGLDAVVSQYVRPFRSATHTVSVIHDVLFLDFPALFGWRYRMTRRLLFGWAARHSDVIVTVSDYSRDRIAHHFGIEADRIDVLPNAVDITGPIVSAHAPTSGAPLRLLYVSRFETRKRQHWCVAAARALARRGTPVELTLVGNADGTYADEVRRMIAAETVPTATIAVRSDIDNAELASLFARTDLFLFPSECEGFGIPVIEAAAHGIPCVVAANTAMTELAGIYAGRSVTSGNSDAFSDAVIDASNDLTMLKKQATAGAATVRRAYHWPDVARRFIDILERRGVLV